MKINSINNVNNKIQKDEKQTNLQSSNMTKEINSLSSVYPQNYYVSFCAGRDFNTAYTDFKDSEMPVTVKNFIENEQLLSSPKEFRELTSKGLKYLQKLAFIKLDKCKTIEDIQKTYPNEDAFKELKSIQQIENNSFGPIMKELDKNGEKILTSKEDVPTFLAKKIFLEGKMYKDVANDFINALSPAAKKAGLQEALPNIGAMGASKFCGVFGLKTPNGLTYGSALQYSDPESTRYVRKYLTDLSPEQVNEKIKDLLQSPNIKPKYAMMDAWNKCPNIRKDLSQFISENANNPLFMPIDGEENYDFYDNIFYSRMSKLMISFWKKYPEHKTAIGKEIKLALERFDEKNAIGGEEFEAYLKSIEEKSKEIRKSIQIDKIDFKMDFPLVDKMLKIIASKANPMLIKSSVADNDFADLLSKCFSLSEIKVLNGDEKTEEYQKLVPNGIKQKMVDLVKRPVYSNLYNAQNLAFVKQGLNNNSLKERNLEPIINQRENIKDFIIRNKKLQLQNGKISAFDGKNLEEIYNLYKKPLSKQEKDLVEKQLLKNVSLKEHKDYYNFSQMLSTQGKYLLNILDDNQLKDFTQVQFWQEYDRIFNTSFTEEAVKNMKQQKLYSQAADVINTIDFTQIHKKSW